MDPLGVGPAGGPVGEHCLAVGGGGGAATGDSDRCAARATACVRELWQRRDHWQRLRVSSATRVALCKGGESHTSGGRLRRRLQVDNALGECTTITITYSAESDLESISDEIDSLSAQATS